LPTRRIRGDRGDTDTGVEGDSHSGAHGIGIGIP
jgi:hypothetical protein